MGSHVAVDHVEATDNTDESDTVATGDWHARVIIEPDGVKVYTYHGQGDTRTDAIYDAVALAEDVHPDLDES